MWTTALVPSRCCLYVVGLRISALIQLTSLDHDGGCGEDETDDHDGSPDRLQPVCQFHIHLDPGRLTSTKQRPILLLPRIYIFLIQEIRFLLQLRSSSSL